jgi:hypothetical protein
MQDIHQAFPGKKYLLVAKEDQPHVEKYGKYFTIIESAEFWIGNKLVLITADPEYIDENHDVVYTVCGNEKVPSQIVCLDGTFIHL